MVEFNYFEQAGNKLADLIKANPMYNIVTDKTEPCPDIDVTLTASNHFLNNHQIMPVLAGHLSDEKEQKPKTLRAKIKIPEGYSLESLKKALLDGVEKLLEVKMPDGSLLANNIDLSGKEEPTHKQKATILKQQLTELVAQNEPNFTLAEKALLTASNSLEADQHTWHNHYFGESEKGVTFLNMNVRDWEGNIEKDLHLEGATSLQSRVEENLKNRKDEIIQSIKNYLNTAIVKNASGEDVSLISQFTEAEILELRKMEAVIDVNGNSEGISTNFFLGQPADDIKPDAKPEDNLKEIAPLKKIPAEILQRAITNSILLAGEKAEEIAPIISDTSSIKDLLEEKAKLPELGEAVNKLLHGNELLMTRDEIEAKEKAAKPKAVVGEPYLVKKDNFIDVAVELPKGISAGNVIASILNIRPIAIKPAVVGEHTAKAAANNENYLMRANSHNI